MWSNQSPENQRDNAGLMAGYVHAQGSVKGNAVGWQNYGVGRAQFDGGSFGGYWTHIGKTDWYLDTVMLYSWFTGEGISQRGMSVEINNNDFLISFEGGYPFKFFNAFKLEPQAQIIWQYLPSIDQVDNVSNIYFNKNNSADGRLGLRLQADLVSRFGLFQPYLRTNLWHHFANDSIVRFATTDIATPLQGTALQVGGGVVHVFSNAISAFALSDYTFDVHGEEERTWDAYAGITIHWD